MRLSEGSRTPQGQKQGGKQATITISVILGFIVLCTIAVAVIGCEKQVSNVEMLPEIVSFQANPPINSRNPVSYTFEVKNATEIRLIEAGYTIKEINSLSSNIYKGAVTGQVHSAVPTSDNYTLDAVLEASNEYGKVEKKITQSGSQLLRPVGWIHDCTPPCICMTPSQAQSENMTSQCSPDPCYRPFGWRSWFSGGGLSFGPTYYCYGPCTWGDTKVKTCTDT